MQIGVDPKGFGPHYPVLHLADGTEILFGHTQDVVGSPRPLQKGEVFAHTGNEGMSTGPHVHVQVNASPGDYKHTKDPVPYLAPQEVTDMMTPSDFEAVVRLAFVAGLGREPTPDDLKQYQSAINDRNAGAIVTGVLDSPEGQAWRDHLHKAKES